MKKINSKEELIKMLESIRRMEVRAKEEYHKDEITFTNFKIVDTVTRIKKDEERHIELFDEMLAILKEKPSQ